MCSTLSPARVPPSRATRRLSSMARASRAKGSGEGGGGPGHGSEEMVQLGPGLPSRLENSSTRRAKEPVDRRASLWHKAGSSASCGMGGKRGAELGQPAGRAANASHDPPSHQSDWKASAKRPPAGDLEPAKPHTPPPSFSQLEPNPISDVNLLATPPTLRQCYLKTKESHSFKELP